MAPPGSHTCQQYLLTDSARLPACRCLLYASMASSRCSSSPCTQPMASAERQCHRLCSTGGQPMPVATSSYAKHTMPTAAEPRWVWKLLRRCLWASACCRNLPCTHSSSSNKQTRHNKSGTPKEPSTELKHAASKLKQSANCKHVDQQTDPGEGHGSCRVCACAEAVSS